MKDTSLGGSTLRGLVILLAVAGCSRDRALGGGRGDGAAGSSPAASAGPRNERHDLTTFEVAITGHVSKTARGLEFEAGTVLAVPVRGTDARPVDTAPDRLDVVSHDGTRTSYALRIRLPPVLNDDVGRSKSGELAISETGSLAPMFVRMTPDVDRLEVIIDNSAVYALQRPPQSPALESVSFEPVAPPDGRYRARWTVRNPAGATYSWDVRSEVSTSSGRSSDSTGEAFVDPQFASRALAAVDVSVEVTDAFSLSVWKRSDAVPVPSQPVTLAFAGGAHYHGPRTQYPAAVGSLNFPLALGSLEPIANFDVRWTVNGLTVRNDARAEHAPHVERDGSLTFFADAAGEYALTATVTQKVRHEMTATNSFVLEIGGGEARQPPSLPSGPGGDEPFNRPRAAAVLAEAAGTLAGCRNKGGPSGEGHISITFAPNGTVRSALVNQPPFARTGKGACVADRFRVVRIRPFQGTDTTVGKSFTLL